MRNRWLVAPDVMVTNRHVALGYANRGSLACRSSALGAIGASIDFRKELDSDAARLFEVLRRLRIGGSDGPDVALFQVGAVVGRRTAVPSIELSQDFPTGPAKVSVIGYAASDSQIPKQGLMNRISGQMYNSERLAPRRGDVGRIGPESSPTAPRWVGTPDRPWSILTSGRALGLHFSGRFLETNYAVRADVGGAAPREPARRETPGPQRADACLPPRPRAARLALQAARQRR